LAISFGFIDKLEARKIMQKFLDKFREVGFTPVFLTGTPIKKADFEPAFR